MRSRSKGVCTEFGIGTGGDEEGGEKGNLCGAMPARELLERIGAEEKKETGEWGMLRAQAEQSVDGEVGLAIVAWGVEETECKSRFVRDGEGGHGGAMGELCGRRGVDLERLAGDGRKEDGVELEGGERGVCDGEMTVVRRVKAAAEEGDALWERGGCGRRRGGRGWLIRRRHESIVTKDGARRRRMKMGADIVARASTRRMGPPWNR